MPLSPLLSSISILARPPHASAHGATESRPPRRRRPHPSSHASSPPPRPGSTASTRAARLRIGRSVLAPGRSASALGRSASTAADPPPRRAPLTRNGPDLGHQAKQRPLHAGEGEDGGGSTDEVEEGSRHGKLGMRRWISPAGSSSRLSTSTLAAPPRDCRSPLVRADAGQLQLGAGDLRLSTAREIGEEDGCGSAGLRVGWTRRGGAGGNGKTRGRLRREDG